MNKKTLEANLSSFRYKKELKIARQQTLEAILRETKNSIVLLDGRITEYMKELEEIANDES